MKIKINFVYESNESMLGVGVEVLFHLFFTLNVAKDSPYRPRSFLPVTN